jgi:hypothetical protein
MDDTIERAGNAYHALQIARDARLEGRQVEYDAVMADLTDVEHREHSVRMPLQLRVLASEVRDGYYSFVDLRRALGWAAMAEWQRRPTPHVIDDGAIEARMRIYAQMQSSMPGCNGMFATDLLNESGRRMTAQLEASQADGLLVTSMTAGDATNFRIAMEWSES